MRKVSATFLILFVFFGCIQSSHAQYSGDYEYSTEMLFGVTKATNSGLIGGFLFKYTKELKDDHFHGGILELVNIKHPQEQRYYRESSFILGKEHYLYSIRLSYTREVTFFKKASQQGVQVNGLIAGGPTIALEAPYYVQVGYGSYTKNEPYDHTKNQNVLGSGYLLQGVGQSSVVPGLNLKGGVSFEFGSFKSNVVGLEVGFQCDFFTRQILIIPTTENYSIFPSAYVTLFYGSRH